MKHLLEVSQGMEIELGDGILTEQYVERIRAGEVFLDEEATARREAQAREVFDGILEVRMQGLFPVFAPWDRIVTWRSPEKMLLDLAMRPVSEADYQASKKEVAKLTPNPAPSPKQ